MIKIPVRLILFVNILGGKYCCLYAYLGIVFSEHFWNCVHSFCMRLCFTCFKIWPLFSLCVCHWTYHSSPQAQLTWRVILLYWLNFSSYFFLTGGVSRNSFSKCEFETQYIRDLHLWFSYFRITLKRIKADRMRCVCQNSLVPQLCF